MIATIVKYLIIVAALLGFFVIGSQVAPLQVARLGWGWITVIALVVGAYLSSKIKL